MKIWRLVDPKDDRYAPASGRGTWSPGKGLCPECTASSQERIQPLVLEWEPGSDEIGDFTWPGLGNAAVTERARDVLMKLGGSEPRAVEMYQDTKLKRPRSPRRAIPRIWLPYEGPPLFDFRVMHCLHADPEKSSVTLVRGCGTCDWRRYEVAGIERRETTWDRERPSSEKIHIPREPGRGIYVRESQLAEGGLFRVQEFPAWMLCTDSAKERMEEASLSNIAFVEVGETF
jgi:hypothetical protein